MCFISHLERGSTRGCTAYCGDVKKRSELSSKLLEEAHKLEMMEGRQQMKTKVEKSLFNVIDNQAAATGRGMKGNNSIQNTSRVGEVS